MTDISKAKKIIFWVILIDFIIVCGWWVFYFPYNRERLYRAIPENATFISEHQKIADRWVDIADTTLAKSAFKTFNAEEEITSITNDPIITTLLNKLAAENTVVAYTPALSRMLKETPDGYETIDVPGWVTVSWAGTSSQFLRWGLLNAGLDLKKEILPRGKVIWVSKEASKEGFRFSVAVKEGLLIVCYSQDQFAVRHITNRLEKKKSLHPQLQTNIAKGNTADQPDKGWFVSHDFALANRPLVLNYNLNGLQNDILKGSITGNQRILQSGPLADSPELKTVENLLGNTPAIISLAPFKYLEGFLADPSASDDIKAIREIITNEAVPESSMFICLAGAEYSGRLFRLKVPAILIGIKVHEETDTFKFASKIIDILNKQHKLSLIPRLVSMDPSIVAIEETQKGLFSSLGNKDKPAITKKDNWLIASSSIESLEKLLAREDSQQPARWKKNLTDKPSTSYTWIDLKETESALQNAIAVYTLILRLTNPAESQELCAQLELVSKGLKSLSPMKTASFWLNPDQNEFKIDFVIGEKDTSPANAAD